MKTKLKNNLDPNFDFTVLSGVQKVIAKAIIKRIKKDIQNPLSGGCKAFYTPQEWVERGGIYGRESFLIVCHDGGDLAPYFSLDYRMYDHYHKMEKALKKIGFYQEQCTNWYSAIFSTQT